MKSSIRNDLLNSLNWKVKSAYFFILFGLVMPWTQLNVHLNSLGLNDRDLSDFMVISAVITIILPFTSGFLGDKLGNFKNLLFKLMAALGICTISFAFVPSTRQIEQNCEVLDVICSQNVTGANLKSCNIMNTDVIYSIIKNETVDNDRLGTIDYIGFNTSKNYDKIIHGCQRSYQTSYWCYLTVRSIFTLLAASCYTLFDGAVLSMAKENKLEYGLQRAWGTLGAFVSSLLGGYLVDFYSSYRQTKDFSLMFYCAGSSFILASFIVLNLDITYRKPAICLTKDLLKGLFRLEFLALSFAILIKGILMTYSETFMYQYLSKMGLSHTLLGATIAVGAVLEIVLQVISGNIFNLMGIQTIIPIGILCYAIRFIGLSVIQDPKLSLAFEPLDAWAGGLTDTAMYIYSTSLFPESTVATIRGIIGSLHSGFGRLISAKAGIEIIEIYGTRFSWKIISIIAFISSLLYTVFLVIYNLCRRKRDIS